MSSDKRLIEIKNKKAYYTYFIEDEIEVGIVLTGTEVKAVRAGKVSLSDAYCYFRRHELYVKSLYIGHYDHGHRMNHEERRERKLLAKRQELKKMKRKLDERGYTIVPVSMYINERGMIKLLVGMARGKKRHDKRHTVKEKDLARDMQRRRHDDY